MTATEIVDLTHRWFEEVWNNRNEDIIDELAEEDAIAEGVGVDGCTMNGRDHFKVLRRQYLTMFPDLHITVEKVAVDVDQSVSWLTCRGTVDPAFFELEGSPKHVTFSAVNWVTVRGGRFSAGKNLIDFASVMRQLKG